MITTSDTNDEAQDDNGNLINFLFAITLKNVDRITINFYTTLTKICKITVRL